MNIKIDLSIDRTKGFEKGKKYIIENIGMEEWAMIRDEIKKVLTETEDPTRKRSLFRYYLHGQIMKVSYERIMSIEMILKKYNIAPKKFWGKIEQETNEEETNKK